MPELIRRLHFEQVRSYARKNPQLVLSAALFLVGAATVRYIAPLAGALFGSGASLLGAWINEIQNRQSKEEESHRKVDEARRFFSPELYRTIERLLYIHERAIPNFTGASAEWEIKPNDLKEDFVPYLPKLFPDVPQFRDLTGEQAVALVAYYDSLNLIKDFVTDWWNRSGQLQVNIFNVIIHHADTSLEKALVCIELFDLEAQFPPSVEVLGSIKARIARSRLGAEKARLLHIKRFEANSKARP